MPTVGGSTSRPQADLDVGAQRDGGPERSEGRAARRLLSDATAIQTAFGDVRVVSTEGLIGLKIQAFVNNPRRT
ncbi:MAG: hypothetical protein QOD56_2275 [Gammaproteobacteria bacterium]|nr:hypothetical protein [Gammaproteobacteria bacterium]